MIPLFSTPISVTLFNSSCDKVPLPSLSIVVFETYSLKVLSGKFVGFISTPPSAITGVMIKFIKIIITAKSIAMCLSFFFFIILTPLIKFSNFFLEYIVYYKNIFHITQKDDFLKYLIYKYFPLSILYLIKSICTSPKRVIFKKFFC